MFHNFQQVLKTLFTNFSLPVFTHISENANFSCFSRQAAKITKGNVKSVCEKFVKKELCKKREDFFHIFPVVFSQVFHNR
jgi:hypothetical protein